MIEGEGYTLGKLGKMDADRVELTIFISFLYIFVQ